eukprot:3294226-Pyramimonas_sp.AAC.1
MRGESIYDGKTQRSRLLRYQGEAVDRDGGRWIVEGFVSVSRALSVTKGAHVKVDSDVHVDNIALLFQNEKGCQACDDC